MASDATQSVLPPRGHPAEGQVWTGRLELSPGLLQHRLQLSTGMTLTVRCAHASCLISKAGRFGIIKDDMLAYFTFLAKQKEDIFDFFS